MSSRYIARPGQTWRWKDKPSAEVEIIDAYGLFISGTGKRAISYRNVIARANVYVCEEGEFYQNFECVREGRANV